jgi:fatty-acid peroxygenase
MTAIPRDPLPDSSLALLSEGYRFFPNRFRRFDSDVFEARLLLRTALCARGAEAASVLYGGVPFTRNGAVPLSTLVLIQDKGSVLTLDGEAHHHRKAMFRSVLGDDAARRLADRFEEAWRGRLPAWARARRVVLLDEAHELLCVAACAWAGVPLPDRDGGRLTRDFVSMFEGATTLSPRTLVGLARRPRVERWARDVILDVRDGAPAPPGSPVREVAFHRDPDGSLLPPGVAAVELINLLRPTVAVGRFVAYAALALHRHPRLRDGLAAEDDAARERFAQEIRRFYPFIPMLGGRALEPFSWRGRRFPRGTWLLLDVSGTNRDRRSWADPDAFCPDRFRTWDGDPFSLVHQGAGDAATNHRCPGERATIELIKRATGLLTGAMTYDVPPQDLGIDPSRMPAKPASGFVMANVRAAG